jgi:DNA repair photolyase
MMRRALEIIRDESTLNVRILTRSPLVKSDFALLKSFGNRLVLGISLPTLKTNLARIYEPHAPAPAQRLKVLHEAAAYGIPTYVAMAPTFPESDYDDLLATLNAVKGANPVTIFHEPINIRAENVERIAAHARELGVPFRADAFATTEAWEQYALGAFADMERAAREAGVFDKLHLWVDGALGSQKFRRTHADPAAYSAWVDYWWGRISEWPGEVKAELNSELAPPNPFVGNQNNTGGPVA